MICPKCQKELPEDAKFCLECGTPLKSKESELENNEVKEIKEEVVQETVTDEPETQEVTEDETETQDEVEDDSESLEETIETSEEETVEEVQEETKETKEEESITAEYTPESENHYTVTCKINENNNCIFQISVFAGSREEAKKIVDNWKENAYRIYPQILNDLNN